MVVCPCLVLRKCSFRHRATSSANHRGGKVLKGWAIVQKLPEHWAGLLHRKLPGKLTWEFCLRVDFQPLSALPRKSWPAVFFAKVVVAWWTDVVAFLKAI